MIYLSNRDSDSMKIAPWPNADSSIMMDPGLNFRMSQFSNTFYYNHYALDQMKTDTMLMAPTPADLKKEIACNSSSPTSNDIPIPDIPTELRKSLSDAMFGPKKSSVSSNEEVRNSKHFSTHAKKSHKVRF